jgi:hypothetical protein
LYFLTILKFIKMKILKNVIIGNQTFFRDND